MLFPCFDLVAQLLTKMVVLVESIVSRAGNVEKAAELRDGQHCIESHILKGFITQVEAFDNLCEVGWVRGVVHPKAWKEVELAEEVVCLLATIKCELSFISEQVVNFSDFVKLCEDIEQFSVLVFEPLISVVLKELAELVKDADSFFAVVHID